LLLLLWSLPPMPVSVPTSLLALFEQACQHHADTPLLMEGDTELTGQQAQAHVQQLATALQTQYGIQAGQHVGLLLGNQCEFILGLLALRALGAVAVPFNLFMSPDDLMYVLRHSQVRLVLTESELAQTMASRLGMDLGNVPLPLVIANRPADAQPLPAPHACWQELVAASADAPLPFPQAPAQADTTMALLIYTSGTTGEPKGVMLSEANLLHNMQGFSAVLTLEALATQGVDLRMLMGLPLFHGYGLICAMYALWLKAPLVLVPKFQPKALLEAIAKRQVSILPLVPTLFHVLVQQADKLPAHLLESVKVCISGGAALPAELLLRAEQILGAPIYEGYGMTETSPVIAVNGPVVGRQPGAVGAPLPNVQVRLLSLATGQSVDASQLASQGNAQTLLSDEGEVQIKGDNVMLGYFQNPQATAEVMLPNGWLKTGDLARYDAQGRLVITGRIKELIIKGGENISPLPIERALLAHPAVAEAAVVPQADAVVGEKIVACLAFIPDADAEAMLREVKHHLRQHLTPLMQPDVYHILPELPKTPTGKVMKKRLKADLALATANPCHHH
jgi:long-chain acyl-CoA synthetase